MEALPPNHHHCPGNKRDDLAVISQSPYNCMNKTNHMNTRDVFQHNKSPGVSKRDLRIEIVLARLNWVIFITPVLGNLVWIHVRHHNHNI